MCDEERSDDEMSDEEERFAVLTATMVKGFELVFQTLASKGVVTAPDVQIMVHAWAEALRDGSEKAGAETTAFYIATLLEDMGNRVGAS
jgi:hypothetical protein